MGHFDILLLWLSIVIYTYSLGPLFSTSKGNIGNKIRTMYVFSCDYDFQDDGCIDLLQIPSQLGYLRNNTKIKTFTVQVMNSI